MKPLIGFFFKVVSFFISHLPYCLQKALGWCLGTLWFDILRIRRQVAVDNVGIAFPHLSLKERTKMARASILHMGLSLIEYADFPFLQMDDLEKRFVFEGRENIVESLRQGKGVLFMTLHLGNGDMAIAGLSLEGWPVHLISKEFRAKWLNDLWFGMRGRLGTKFISPEKSTFDILRALRKNEIVIFVLDQFMGPPIGVRTQFFGRETGTAAGLAYIAGRTGAPVIPCYTYRRYDGKNVMVFEKPIPFLDDGPRDKNISVMTQKYTDKIEEIVRKYPEQWMWIHRRWKEFRE